MELIYEVRNDLGDKLIDYLAYREMAVNYLASNTTLNFYLFENTLTEP